MTESERQNAIRAAADSLVYSAYNFAVRLKYLRFWAQALVDYQGGDTLTSDRMSQLAAINRAWAYAAGVRNEQQRLIADANLTVADAAWPPRSNYDDLPLPAYWTQGIAVSRVSGFDAAVDAKIAASIGVATEALSALNSLATDLENNEGLLAAIQGMGIQSATVNESGHLVLTRADATAVDAGIVVGPPGSSGRSVVSSSVNAGHLVLVYSDDSQQDAGALPAPSNDALTALIGPVVTSYFASNPVPEQVNADWTATSGKAQILNKPTLFSGAYSDLSGKPSLFSGVYSDLSGKPDLFSGMYADLAGKPTLGTAAAQSSSAFDASGAAASAQAFSIQRANHTGTQLAATIIDFSAAALTAVTWTTLTGKPTFASVATSGAYGDLSGRPALAAVATSGSYADLSNKPTIVSSVSGTAPVVSSGGSTPAISMASATGSVSGYLASTDWATFNSKQAALTFTVPLVNTANTVTLLAATTGTAGSLSASDKTKLDALTIIGGADAITFANKTANYTATASDGVIFCDTTAAAFTLTIPVASTYISGSKMRPLIVVITGAKTLTVQPVSGMIDNRTKDTITSVYTVIEYWPTPDGVNYVAQ